MSEKNARIYGNTRDGSGHGCVDPDVAPSFREGGFEGCEELQQTNKVAANRQSLLEMLKKVMMQVEYHCFVDLKFSRVDPLYKELCLVIAEAFLLKEDSSVRINGTIVQAQTLKDVYSMLQNDHLRLVFDNFQNVSVRVYNKKGYLRTALYNAVFEIESSCVNDYCRSLID